MIERQVLETDIVCVGFGPATAGFLATLAPRLVEGTGAPAVGSRVAPGLPLQVIAFERADGAGFGVSGAVTRARGIRASFPDFDACQVPLATPVSSERIAYLFDPVGASRRPAGLRTAERLLSIGRWALSRRNHAVELPFVPGFLRKNDGVVLSVGQFTQWVSERVTASSSVQLWPSSPVAAPLFEGSGVVGVRLADQGTDREGRPAGGYLPGMDVRASLTVVGDGPVGAVGREIDRRVGMPGGHAQDEWAVGVKMLVDLPDTCTLAPGAVIHTIGYPEPEIFGFLYVHEGRCASIGIFIPSFLDTPVRAAYRYLQHWMLHPYLSTHLRGGAMRSWGAKSLQESGWRGEPFLVGDGYARIGEGSGTTNVLSGSGIDEAWTTGVQLAEAVLELLAAGDGFTRENLERTYVARRRASWVGEEARAAANARNGFGRGVVRGLIGMALAGMTGGRLSLGVRHDAKRTLRFADFAEGRVGAEELERMVRQCRDAGTPVHDALMDRVGWPQVPLDGRLLVSHQDALLTGGKVQAPAGYADHVVFLNPGACAACGDQSCVEACSGQAITPGPGRVPVFDRDKCVHCGACSWNCLHDAGDGSGRTNLDFRAGAGGLRSAAN
jgi:electron-transferring-flavoprotein dehydrogenase